MNYTGANAKSLYVSVEESLKKLRTSYIDLLYVHWWDWGTSVEEVMNALHQLVQARMVLYLVRSPRSPSRILFGLQRLYARVYLIRQPGWSPKQISMLV